MSVAGEIVDHRKVVDPSKADDADPYVVALALTLKREGHSVCVVADDVVDHSPRISIATACGRLGLACATSSEFLKRSGLLPLKKPG